MLTYKSRNWNRNLATMIFVWLATVRYSECGLHKLFMKHHMPRHHEQEDSKGISFKAIPIPIPIAVAPPMKGWPAPPPMKAWPAPPPAWPAPPPLWPPPKGKMPWKPKMKKMDKKLKKVKKWVKKLKKEVKKLKKCARLPPCGMMMTPAPAPAPAPAPDGDDDYDYNEEPNVLAPVFVLPPKMTMVIKHITSNSDYPSKHQRYKRQSQNTLISTFKSQLNRNLEKDKKVVNPILMKPAKLLLNDHHHAEDKETKDPRNVIPSRKSRNLARLNKKLEQHRNEMRTNIIHNSSLQLKDKPRRPNISTSPYNQQKMSQQPQKNMSFPEKFTEENSSVIHQRQKRASFAMVQNGMLCCPNQCCGGSGDDWDDWDDDWEDDDDWEEEEEEGWNTKQLNHYIMTKRRNLRYHRKGDRGLYHSYHRSRG